MQKGTIVVLLLFIMTGCTAEDADRRNDGNRELRLSDPVDIQTLNDDLEILDNIHIVHSLDGERLLVADSKPSVSLFENHEMISRIGTSGSGPCEYEHISAIDVIGDTLYVLSANQSKIISFSIDSGECLDETGHPNLSNKFYLTRITDGFIVGRMSYTLATPDSLPALEKLDDQGTISALDLELGNLNRIKTAVNMRAPGLDFSRHNDELFIYFPLTTDMHVYDIGGNTFRTFPLKLDIRREEITAAGEDINKILEIIRGDFEFVLHTYATDFGLLVQHASNPRSDGASRVARLYSYEGELLGEWALEYEIVASDGDNLLELREAADPASEYSYEIAYRQLGY